MRVLALTILATSALVAAAPVATNELVLLETRAPDYAVCYAHSYSSVYPL